MLVVRAVTAFFFGLASVSSAAEAILLASSTLALVEAVAATFLALLLVAVAWVVVLALALALALVVAFAASSGFASTSASGLPLHGYLS